MLRSVMRLVHVYLTLARVLASYLWLRVERPLLSRRRYAARLEHRHRANARRIQRAIVRAGGLFVKVGQVISILANLLPPEFRRELESLQDRLPPRPIGEIETALRAELGRPPEEVFASFDTVPLATASLAQVHAATLHDGRRVAVKVRHADIEQIARADLETIRRILIIAQTVTGVRGIESYHPEIKALIAEELDFAREARNIDDASRRFVRTPMVRCPAVVHALSTSRLLITEFVTGVKITDFARLAEQGFDRRVIAERVVHAYCQMLFVDGVYHADPHPGNLFVAPDGAIVFVDFGAVGVLAPHMKAGVVAFVEGIIRRDPASIAQAIRTMGFIARGAEAEQVAQRVVDYVQRRFLDQVAGGEWSLDNLRADIDVKLEAIADLRKLNVSLRKLTETFQAPKDWVILERTLLLLIGVATELDASWNPMLVVRPYLEDFVLDNNRDWGHLISASFKSLTRTAVGLPDDVKNTLDRVNRGDVEIHVPEITDAARLLYAGFHQLSACLLAAASGVIGYEAYAGGRHAFGATLFVVMALCLASALRSLLASRPLR
jgi:predicted unusual protein kinase regulating ubiquinone biosynthesis (AarF/ABC1/UbiB family)